MLLFLFIKFIIKQFTPNPLKNECKNWYKRVEKNNIFSINNYSNKIKHQIPI